MKKSFITAVLMSAVSTSALAQAPSATCQWDLANGIFKLPEYYSIASKMDENMAKLHDKNARGGLSSEEKATLADLQLRMNAMEKMRNALARYVCESDPK